MELQRYIPAHDGRGAYCEPNHRGKYYQATDVDPLLSELIVALRGLYVAFPGEYQAPPQHIVKARDVLKKCGVANVG
jgi:hypothetical protein